MHRLQLVRTSLLVAAVTVVTAWACGGGSSGSGSPTQPTPRPSAFTLTVQILGITQVAAPAGFQTTSTPPVQKQVQTRVTVTETGGVVGGIFNEMLFEFMTKSGSKPYSKRYSSADIVAVKGSNKVPAGGTFVFDTTLDFTNTSGDVVNNLRTSGTITGDDSQKATPTTDNAVAPPTPCLPSPTALCAQGGRFKIEAQWRNMMLQTGVGTPRSDTDEGGMFWFFSPNTYDLTVKVLNHCSDTQRFWMFAGATTNVEYTITVTDTSTGATKKYVNPMGQPMPALTDPDAFATCP